MKLSSLHFFALALFSSTPTLALEDWPQHMGPHGDGMSRETKWENQGRSVWEARVGLGYSTVSVVGNRLYTIGWEQKGEDEKSGEDVVRCLDSGTGEVVWSHRYPAQKWAKYHGGGTSTTPSIDGDRVYVVNREASFRCLDTATGKLHWARSLGEGLELETPTWGFAASPLILDDTVIVNVTSHTAYSLEVELPQWAYTPNVIANVTVLAGSSRVANSFDSTMTFEWKSSWTTIVDEALMVLASTSQRPSAANFHTTTTSFLHTPILCCRCRPIRSFSRHHDGDHGKKVAPSFLSMRAVSRCCR